MNLDALNDRLMHRVQYRNFGGYQTLVGNHTVDTNNPAGIAGIHWFELRNTGTDWTMYQQGTYGLSDSVNRWMGSIAMDGSGNMALGYSVSSSSIYPGIRYVGPAGERRAGHHGAERDDPDLRRRVSVAAATAAGATTAPCRWIPPTTPPSGSRRSTWPRAALPAG